MTLGQLLREARKRAGLTQSEVSAKSGIAQPNLSEYEADLKSPSFQIVQRIAQAIGVKLSRLVKPLDGCQGSNQ